MNDPVIVPPRRSLTARQRVKLFDAHNGVCHICTLKIMVGEPWIDEHIDPREISANDDMSNRAPAHVACAKKKNKKDMKDIAKVYRVRARHLGIRKAGRRLPGGRESTLKRKMNGEVVVRSTGKRA